LFYGILSQEVPLLNEPLEACLSPFVVLNSVSTYKNRSLL